MACFATFSAWFILLIDICHIVIAPAQISINSMNQALNVAKHAISSLPGAGIYGVELFLLPDDSILLNEIAPR